MSHGEQRIDLVPFHQEHKEKRKNQRLEIRNCEEGNEINQQDEDIMNEIAQGRTVKQKTSTDYYIPESHWISLLISIFICELAKCTLLLVPDSKIKIFFIVFSVVLILFSGVSTPLLVYGQVNVGINLTNMSTSRQETTSVQNSNQSNATSNMSLQKSNALLTNSEKIKVFVAKNVVTMDPGWPNATAIAVRGGKIMSAGSLQDLKPWLDAYPHEIIDTFKDKVIMPGFIEPHGHPMMGGILLTRPLLTYFDTLNPYGPTFHGLKSNAEVLAKLREYDASTDANETLLAWGYDPIAIGETRLTAHDLDGVSEVHPVIVWDASEHELYVNTATMKKHNITKDSTKINGVGADASGEPNGQFIGIEAISLLKPELRNLLTTESLQKAMHYIVDLSRKGGITTTSDLSVGALSGSVQGDSKLLKQFFDEPTTPMRLVAVIDGLTAQEEKRENAVNYSISLQNNSTEKTIFKGVKFFNDDSFLSLGMQLNYPGYVDGRTGLWNNAPGEDFVKLMLPWWLAGFQIHVHTNGNAAQESLLHALAALQNEKPRFDHRFTFEHFGLSTPAQALKLKALGALASVNPSYVYNRGEINEKYLGTDVADTASRLGTLTKAGVPTTLHSDTPVAAPNPLEWAWIAVNRFGQSGKVLAPGERVTVDDALKMITINAAYDLGIEDKIGSIEPGKFADFVILNENPYDVLPEKIRDIGIWGTVVGGEIYPISEIKPQ